MFRAVTLIAAAGLTIASGAPDEKSASQAVRPGPAPTTLNCLLASNFFAQKATDPKQRMVAFQILYFYLGRLGPRVNSEELKAALKRTRDGLKGVSAAPLMNACLHDVQAKAQTLQSVGQQLQQGK